MCVCVCVCVCVYAYPPKTTLVFHPQFLLPTHHILTYSNTLHGIKRLQCFFNDRGRPQEFPVIKCKTHHVKHNHPNAPIFLTHTHTHTHTYTNKHVLPTRTQHHTHHIKHTSAYIHATPTYSHIHTFIHMELATICASGDNPWF